MNRHGPAWLQTLFRLDLRPRLIDFVFIFIFVAGVVVDQTQKGIPTRWAFLAWQEHAHKRTFCQEGEQGLLAGVRSPIKWSVVLLWRRAYVFDQGTTKPMQTRVVLAVTNANTCCYIILSRQFDHPGEDELPQPRDVSKRCYNELQPRFRGHVGNPCCNSNLVPKFVEISCHPARINALFWPWTWFLKERISYYNIIYISPKISMDIRTHVSDDAESCRQMWVSQIVRETREVGRCG